MEIVRSRARVPVRLTDERWKHISENHPGVLGMRTEILETLSDPDLLQAGDSGEILAVRRYEKTPLTSKFLIVPYREVSPDDGFVLTAYLTSLPSSSRIVTWKR